MQGKRFKSDQKKYLTGIQRKRAVKPQDLVIRSNDSEQTKRTGYRGR